MIEESTGKCAVSLFKCVLMKELNSILIRNGSLIIMIWMQERISYCINYNFINSFIAESL